MSKTPKEIHALAPAFSGELHEDNTIAYHHAKDVLTWLFDRPLADRLTEEEKERIRREYRKSYSLSFEQSTCLDRQYARGRCSVLREIFGSEFFKEEGR